MRRDEIHKVILLVETTAIVTRATKFQAGIPQPNLVARKNIAEGTTSMDTVMTRVAEGCDRGISTNVSSTMMAVGTTMESH